MTITIIAAMGRNRVIGRDGGLPWRLPADLKFFKSQTMGHHLIMGRRTWAELGKPLPGRTNIVVTRNQDFEADGAIVVRSFEAALEYSNGEEEVFVAGGAEIYKLALPVCDRMHLTLIDEEFEGDTFFPAYDKGEWELVGEELHEADERNRWAYRFTTWGRPRVD